MYSSFVVFDEKSGFGYLISLLFRLHGNEIIIFSRQSAAVVVFVFWTQRIYFLMTAANCVVEVFFNSIYILSTFDVDVFEDLHWQTGIAFKLYLGMKSVLFNNVGVN